MITKICQRCGEANPLSAYHVSHQRKDGLGVWCKVCVAEHAKDTRAQGRERATAAQRAWRERNRAKTIQYAKSHNQRSPDKYRARQAIKQELKMGRILRGVCEICQNPKTDAHHDDYSKPLEVRWLCRRHHVEHHTKLKHEHANH